MKEGIEEWMLTRPVPSSILEKKMEVFERFVGFISKVHRKYGFDARKIG
jgi:hypothetical protein